MDLWPFIQYRAVVGSRAFGLETDGSDTDVRGFYLPPARLHWGLGSLPEQLENDERQECFWELGKFLKLALACNPNVLETMNSSIVEFASPLAEELRAMRASVLSTLAYEKYSKYAEAQLRRLSASLAKDEGVNWKHAMHMLRLQIAGAHLLRSGEVQVDVSPYRERLLEVKRGEVSWEHVEAWSADLAADMELALASTRLPAEPDRAEVNDFLIRARRSMLDV